MQMTKISKNTNAILLRFAEQLIGTDATVFNVFWHNFTTKKPLMTVGSFPPGHSANRSIIMNVWNVLRARNCRFAELVVSAHFPLKKEKAQNKSHPALHDSATLHYCSKCEYVSAPWQGTSNVHESACEMGGGIRNNMYIMCCSYIHEQTQSMYLCCGKC